MLLVRWEEDDLGTQSEISDLDDVFRNLYRFKTAQFLIPSTKPYNSLERRLFQWRETDDEDGQNLMILYYGGHGERSMEWRPPYKSVWAANRHSDSPALDWTDLQSVLHHTESDLVMILDCCHAAATTKAYGVKEGLWATNSTARTLGVNDNSFTRNLIHCLKDLHGTRFNAVMLHQHLMIRYRKRESPMLQTEPVYSFLGSEMAPSAELSVHHVTTSSPNPSQTITLPGSETLVLLGVRLKSVNSIPDVTSWGSWLRNNAPDEVDSVVVLCKRKIKDIIRLQGFYESNSVLVLITIPLCLWNRLPSLEAYQFISYVMSTNLVEAND